jgi:hypothetical protein
MSSPKILLLFKNPSYSLASVSHWCYKKSISITIDNRVDMTGFQHLGIEGVGNDVDAYGPVP